MEPRQPSNKCNTSAINDENQEAEEQLTDTDNSASQEKAEELRTMRDRINTSKGIEWQTNHLITRLKSAASKWRKCACAIEILISISKDVSTL